MYSDSLCVVRSGVQWEDERSEILRRVRDLYYKDINGKDILLIDDTLTFGQSIVESVNLILDAYTPKSITVLTMFSRKVYY